MKGISVLGSTGSIGIQTLDVVRNNKDKFKIAALAVNKSIDKLVEQIVEFEPKLAVVYDEKKALELEEIVIKRGLKVEVQSGMEGLKKAASMDECQVVLTAVVGMIGLIPTLEAIRAKKDIALANKETLVTAGEIVMEEAKRNNVKILPVDSEHSAIFQCLNGENMSSLKKIILTASGGPFRGKKRDEIKDVGFEQALRHPKWDMGRKISIDSATLMNKGLEVIEAKWLFDVELKDIQVVVHPQSIIHSMVEFEDTSIIAQLGNPDMRVPIQYALFYPERGEGNYESLDLFKLKTLTFEEPDLETFPCLKLAYEALENGGNYPCVLNAANEVLVSEYLDAKIGFYDIPKYIELAMKNVKFIEKPNLEEILESDQWAREFVAKEILNMKNN